MRPSNKSRSRNKPGSNGSHNQRRNTMGNIINRVFESAGPDGKVRGTPQQIIDKYQALARDAQVAGDRVAAESYLQHSEHYSRLLGEAQRQQMESRASQEREDGGPRGEDGGFDQQRRPQPSMQPQMPPVVASGLTTIDPDDSEDLAGPIETPEGRQQQPRVQPAPVAEASRAPEGRRQPEARQRQVEPAPAAEVAAPAPAPEAPAEEVQANVAAAEPTPEPPAAEPPKRTRSRRPRATAPAPAATAEEQKADQPAS